MAFDIPTRIAEALGAHLTARMTAGELGQRFDVIVRHFPEKKVPDLSRCKVICRPGRCVQRFMAKRVVQYDATIDVTVQAQANPSEESTWRAFRTLAETLQTEVATIGRFGPGGLLEWENDPPFDFIQAKEIHVFKSTTLFTFRASKEL